MWSPSSNAGIDAQGSSAIQVQSVGKGDPWIMAHGPTDYCCRLCHVIITNKNRQSFLNLEVTKGWGHRTMDPLTPLEPKEY